MGFVGVVAVVLMTVAACSSGAVPDDTPPEATTPVADAGTTASTAGDTAGTTVAEMAPAQPEPGWVRVADDGGSFGGDGLQTMNAVTAGGPGVVAVGFSGLGVGAVWTSPDGLAWARVSDDEGIFSADSSTKLNAVVAGGPGVVAAGANSAGAAVWTSPDGETWSLVSDEGTFGGSQEIYGLTAGGPGFVAVGTTGYVEGSAAAVWTSPDGIAWTRIPDTAETYTAGTRATMTAVAVAGSGLVAVGRDHHDDTDAAVWTSPDGITWTRVPHDAAIFGGPDDQTMEAVTPGGPGLVAVGQDGGGDGVGAAVWTSPDGRAWTRIPADLDTFGGSEARGMWGITTDGPELVAVGAVGSGSAIWTSPDGVVWVSVPQNQGDFENDGGSMHAITAGGPGLVAVGQEYSGSDPDAAVWVKTASG